MNIAVIGTGYVGIVQAVGLSELGFQVAGYDIDSSKISMLKKGRVPIYEPGLSALLKKNLKSGRLNFTNDANTAINRADVIFIAVGTPASHDRSVNLKYVRNAAMLIAKILNLKSSPQKFRLIVNKSTVPVGTSKLVESIIAKHYKGQFAVVSNPEFLREGRAVYDFLHPDRIIIGGSKKGRLILKKVYKKLRAPTITSDAQTAELTKYAANAFLATSISFINSLSWLSEAVGADINAVAQGMKLDKRIGKDAFLASGPGYGGSCFPKDVAGLAATARTYGLTLPIIDAAQKINQKQKSVIAQKIKMLLPRLKGKRIAIWGLSFKANTDDVRESPAMELIKFLLKQGARVSAYDPVAEANAAKTYPSVAFNDTAIGAVLGADLLIVMTEWPNFKKISPKKIKESLGKPNLVDARNIFDMNKMKKAGINYIGVGR